MGEKVRILGVRTVDYVSKKDGQRVFGKSFYYAFFDPETEGERCDNMYISAQYLDRLTVVPVPGDTVLVLYNRYGRVVDFVPA